MDHPDSFHWGHLTDWLFIWVLWEKGGGRVVGTGCSLTPSLLASRLALDSASQGRVVASQTIWHFRERGYVPFSLVGSLGCGWVSALSFSLKCPSSS